MNFHHNRVRQAVEEDRLSSLPDDLIYKILSCFDTKFAVQTCLLSSRWKLLWTSMPCLNFDSGHFGTLPKFAKFVKDVLSHRNHQVEVSSVKLLYCGFDALFDALVVVKKIANYAFSHNVQDLTLKIPSTSSHVYPPWLFSFQTLKQFTLSCQCCELWDTTKTPLDFPALNTLNLSDVTLWGGDIFSKCVNLKNLTLSTFHVVGQEEAFDIITPRLSNLMLEHCRFPEGINVIAPQLENLTIRYCQIKYLNAPPGLSSFCYTSWCASRLPTYHPLQLSKDGFHSLNKASIRLTIYKENGAYEEKDARKAINMLQALHSARYLTLNTDIAECISSFPDLLSQHASPFSNLICLTIDSPVRKHTYKVTLSSRAINYLLDNSLNATFIMKLPKAQSRR